MKKLIFIIVIFITSISFAQENTSIGKIALSVVLPENIEGMDSYNYSKLESKIIQIVSNSGLAANGYNSNFIIYPKLAIYDNKVVESGMQDITVFNFDLTLIIKQVDNNMIYSSCNISIKGYGNSKQIAISNAISKIKINETTFIDFIDKGKRRIIEYYESRCNDLIVQADGLSKRQSFEEAITLLLSIPSEVSCFSKIQDKTIEIYKNYQTYRCGSLLQQAKALAAQNDLNGSLNYLSQIDPGSKCGIESKDLMTKIENKIDADNRQRWQAAMMIYKDAVQLEKQRINAIRDIAVEYARNQPKPPSNNYLLIIR
jgi:hypothetical protein